MRARVGDRLVIKGHRIHEPDRDAEILEVLGHAGRPPYRIRWSDTGRATLFYPGSDARIQPIVHAHGNLPPGMLGQAARDEAGAPTLVAEEAVGLLRRHIGLETLRTDDHDSELWALWLRELARADPDDPNATVLDHVMSQVRNGG